MKPNAAWALAALQAMSLAYLHSLDSRISNIEGKLMSPPSVVAMSNH